ncbi:DUF1538 domain-containing protein [Ectothiorhodospiraceae bacterium BW-2]|nr:DUF1538 domain-containing protein [Ectothiorhodospiraceae bacterium BW-2]
MPRSIRFAAFTREVNAHHYRVSYNHLTPKPRYDEQGGEIPYKAPLLKLRLIDAWRLIAPYVGVRLKEQLQAVVPLALYLVLLQVVILRQEVTDAGVIAAGLVAVIMGLMLFMEGLKIGLMPFGELIGHSLPTRATLPVVLLIAFLLGIGVTFAEPAIGALKTAGSIVDVNAAPYLYLLLNEWSEVLVLVVGAGVGGAAILGTLRFLYGWSLKPLIYLTLTPTLLLTLYLSLDSDLRPVLGLAWDSGAVTTGPVTVPLVLSLGIGIAAAAGKGHNSSSGFGIVTLASLFPIIAVMLLALFVSQQSSVDEIRLAVAGSQAAEVATEWSRSPWSEIVGGVRAIVPLVLFLLAVLVWVLKERLKQPGHLFFGIALAVVGMIIFSLGLTYGLAKLGSQSGSLVPAAFTTISAVADSPLYSYLVGILIALLFAWVLGFGATLAEPALNALGMTVENLTNGAFPKRLLMLAVSIGVGCGIAVGVAKIIFTIPLVAILLPAYLLAVVLTWLSTEEFVNIAWDSAGVTTGPVTVPLVLSMGLGFGTAVGAVEGFGILAMASIGPILSVLLTGLWVNWKVKRRHLDYDSGLAAAPSLATKREGVGHE